MRWKQKAVLQNAIAHLPVGLSYDLYYLLQKYFGRLRLASPVETLKAGARFLGCLHARGGSVVGKSVLEVGTGRQLNLPLVFWLAGAAEILTLDKNPYLKGEMVLKDLAYMRRNRDQVLELLAPAAGAPGFRRRLAELLAFRGGLAGLLEMTRIRYLAPADAAALPLAGGSIDVHVSFSVFQHVPPETLDGILREGRRILARDGRLLCYVNMTDHFAHDDDSISLINFLRFTDKEWMRLAGNRYMYQNRLRVDDVVRRFGRMGYGLSMVDSKVDERSLRELEGGFRVDRKFAGKSNGVNATLGAWIIAEPVGDCPSRDLPLEAEKLCVLLASNQQMSFHYPPDELVRDHPTQ